LAPPDVRYAFISDQSFRSVAIGRDGPIVSLAPQQNTALLDHLVVASKQRRYRAAFLDHALATS
jgi:hypothetical protein